MKSRDKSLGVNSMLIIFRPLRLSELYIGMSIRREERGPKINPWVIAVF